MDASTPIPFRHDPGTAGSRQRRACCRAARLAAAIAGVCLVASASWLAPVAAQASFRDDPAQAHVDYFTANAYAGTTSCLGCHAEEGQDVVESGHFRWRGATAQIEDAVGEVHGKRDLLNNFCIGVPSNEGRCTQCHIGYGYADDLFDFDDPANVDCLVCHDQTGTYKKAPKAAGQPDPSVDLDLVAQSVALNDGRPTRAACLACHARAGGGDNVKHGDLSSDLVATTRAFDVHMGTDGGDMLCVDCHAPNESGAFNHGIGGMSLHSVDQGEMKQCGDCHGLVGVIHQGTSVRRITGSGRHDRLACQVCHIPAIARAVATKVAWYWSDAGQDVDPIPIDPVTGRALYDKKKGSFEWQYDVRPELRYSNDVWQRKIVNHSDGFRSVPVPLATPRGDALDPDAMIYPFKEMVGDQPVDVQQPRILVPHLFGTRNGNNPYWGLFDWHLALTDGAAYTGQPYSGEFGFARTTMLLSVNHEVPPATQALGMGGDCSDCHGSDRFDWRALGWTGDPDDGGERFRVESPVFANDFERWFVR
jgi:octaheme c-type cytochrome (tetrathionate reductase family)